jgi:hypothetical protein
MELQMDSFRISRRALLGTLAAPLGFAAAARANQRSPRTSHMPRIIVFDVNETLLDVDALKPHFVRAFRDELALREWFSTVLLYSEVASLAGPYSDFGAIGGAALDMTATSRAFRCRWTIARRFSAACDCCPRILRCGPV